VRSTGEKLRLIRHTVNPSNPLKENVTLPNNKNLNAKHVQRDKKKPSAQV
jgi:hypothetical protein